MCLNLGKIFAFDDHIRFGKALFDVARISPLWTVNISLLRNACWATTAACATLSVGRTRENYRSVIGASLGTIDDEWHRVVLNLYQLRRVIRNLLGVSSDAGDWLARVADDRIA